MVGRWTVLLLGLVGCSGGPGSGDSDSGGPEGCASGDIGLEIGTGETGFIPLAAGDPVTMVHGPQGGWHVWTAVRVQNSEPEISILPELTVTDLGGLPISDQQASFVALIHDEATCEGTFTGQRAYIDADRSTGPSGQAFICSLAGKTLELKVTVQDIVSGRTTSESVEVVAQLDPFDVDVCGQ